MPLRHSPIALFASLLLAAALSGCLGPERAPESPPGPETEQSVETEEAPHELPTVDDSDGTSEDAEGETAAGGTEDSGAEASGGQQGAGTPSEDGRQIDKTVLTMVWPDETWEIQEISEDPCKEGEATISRMGLGEDYFTCGPTAMGLAACKQVSDQEALCVQNVMERKAARIHSPAAETHTSPPAEGVIPMGVILADGTTCSYVTHDHMDHHEGRQSWVHCGENAALLLNLTDGSGYFDADGEVWTAELAVGMQPPETVDVAEVIYVATPEDAGAQGDIGP